MTKKMLMVAGVLAIFCSGAAIAAPAETDTLVRQVQSRYAGMSSFRAEFTQTLTHQESGSVENRHGTFLFAKPMLVRWETRAPNSELLIVNNEEVWNNLPGEALAYRYSLDVVRDSQSIILVLTGQTALDSEFNVEAMPDESGLKHLMLYPHEPVANLVEAHIWIDPATSLIRRAMVMDMYGNTNRVEFASITPDVAVNQAEFLFSPPPGFEVEDRRGQTF